MNAPTQPPILISGIIADGNVGKINFINEAGELKSDQLGRGNKGKTFLYSFDTFPAYWNWKQKQPTNVACLCGNWMEGDKEFTTNENLVPGKVAQTKQFLSFTPGSTVLHIDVDTKSVDGESVRGIYPETLLTFDTHQEAVNTLVKVVPWLNGVPMGVSDSSSSMVKDMQGNLIKGRGGLRIDIPVDHGVDVPALLDHIDTLCWANGLGWGFVGSDGSIHKRSMVDAVMKAATQPDFINPQYDGCMGAREVTLFNVEGHTLPTSTIPLLTPDDQRRATAAKAEMANALGQVSLNTKQEHREKETIVIRETTPGITDEEIEKIFSDKDSGILSGALPITFEDGSVFTVNALVEGGGAYDGLPCLDPHEPDYRVKGQIAKFYWNDGINPTINSFAHGEKNYRLKISTSRFDSIRRDVVSLGELVRLNSLSEIGEEAKIPEVTTFTFEDLQSQIDAAGEMDKDARNLIYRRIASSNLTNSDEEDLVQAIKKKFKINLGPIRSDIKSIKGELGNGDGEDEPPVGRELMEACLTDYGADNVIFAEGSIWLWEDRGVWSKYPAEYVDKILIHGPINTLFPEFSFESKHVSDVRNLIKGDRAIPDSMQPKISEQFVNTLDCELHWSEEREEWEVHPHNRDNLSTNQCHFNATRDAKCIRWDRFMKEIFANTGTPQDIAEEIELMQACIGYTMTTSTKFEIFVYTWGPGGNGKTKIMDLLTSIIGAENKSSVHPSEQGNKFQLGHMHKKLANLVPEVHENEVMNAAKTKSVASGEGTTVEHKNGHPFEAEMYATQWYTANHLARCNDHSDAFFDRAIVFYLPNQFRDTAQQELNLGDELEKEKDGIALRCLHSYGEWLKASAKGGRGVVWPKVIKRYVEEWRGESDTVQNFIEDCITLVPTEQTTHGSIFAAYLRWCDVNGMRYPLTKRKLVVRICQNLNVMKGKGAHNVAIVQGIKVSQLWQI